MRLPTRHHALYPQVQRSLDESRQEVVQLKAERDLYEENMKKAFMRGVCALNLEAMSMFRNHDAPQGNGYHSDGEARDPSTQDDIIAPSHPVSNGISAARNLQPAPGHTQHGSHTAAEAPPKTIHLTCTATEGSGGTNPNPRAALQPRNGQQKAPCLPGRGHTRGPAGVSKLTHKSRGGRGPSVVIERHTHSS